VRTPWAPACDADDGDDETDPQGGGGVKILVTDEDVYSER
jgi:hypothetical protein